MGRIFITLVLFFAVLIPLSSLAQQPITVPNPLCPTGNPNCPQGSTVTGVVQSILEWLKNIGAIIAGGMVVFGAFQILTAGGNPEKFSTGRKTILYAVIGYVIIWIGAGLTSIIQTVLTTSP